MGRDDMKSAIYSVLLVIAAVLLFPWSIFIGVPMLAARWLWSGYRRRHTA